MVEIKIPDGVCPGCGSTDKRLVNTSYTYQPDASPAGSKLVAITYTVQCRKFEQAYALAQDPRK
jgi:hypothetical protein